MEKTKQGHLSKSARLGRGVLDRLFWVSLMEKVTGSWWGNEPRELKEEDCYEQE